MHDDFCEHAGQKKVYNREQHSRSRDKKKKVHSAPMGMRGERDAKGIQNFKPIESYTCTSMSLSKSAA